MKKREFNKALNTISTGRGKKKRIDVSKIQLLDDETRKKMVEVIIRHRLPILLELIPEMTDRSWLASCGYFHTTRGAQPGLTFLHTAEYAAIHGIK